MAATLDGTGILGRSTGRLGRFGIARIPKAAPAGAPCPYVPSRQDDNVEAMQWPVEAGPLSDAAPIMLLSVVETVPVFIPLADDAPQEPAEISPTLPVRTDGADDSPLRPVDVLDTAPIRFATDDGQGVHSDSTSESAGQEPVQVAEQAPQHEAPSADAASVRPKECS